MSKTMQALIQSNDGFTDQPSPMQLESLDPYVELAETEVPEPGEGQVLIKVTLASVNPADVMFIKGMYGQRRVKGKPAGFEGVGEVVASGGGARRPHSGARGQEGGRAALRREHRQHGARARDRPRAGVRLAPRALQRGGLRQVRARDADRWPLAACRWPLAAGR